MSPKVPLTVTAGSITSLVLFTVAKNSAALLRTVTNVSFITYILTVTMYSVGYSIIDSVIGANYLATIAIDTQ